jgi:hypothetical protein
MVSMPTSTADTPSHQRGTYESFLPEILYQAEEKGEHNTHYVVPM